MFIWFQVAKENALLLINRNEGRHAKKIIEESKDTVLSTVQVDYANPDISPAKKVTEHEQLTTVH